MRHDKLERELNLLVLLTENHHYTVDDICNRLSISRRNFYYYLDFFRLAGFIVDHRKPYYRIRKDSPFFLKLDEIVHFTEDEAITMRRILDKMGDQSIQVERLRQKLDRLYDLQILDSVELQEQLAHRVTMLYEAIKQKRMVRLVGYSSPHSNTVQDRIVEPFLLMNGNREVRSMEVSSQQNKTFKLSRMADVELLDSNWEYERLHRQLYTDVFMFSAEQQTTVTLLMGRLAISVLREEYPRAECYIQPADDDHWRVEMPVCSYAGIGRFVLGLMEDIDVLGDDGFLQYLREHIGQRVAKINNMTTR